MDLDLDLDLEHTYKETARDAWTNVSREFFFILSKWYLTGAFKVHRA